MDSTLELRRRGRFRSWLSADGPPSRGAQLFLFFSALLCGAAISGLLFVGIWRQTAGDAARTRAAQAGDHQALVRSKRTIAKLNRDLRHERALLARARNDGAEASAALAKAQAATAQARAALARVRAAEGALSRSVTARAGSLRDAADGVVRQTATLRSELTALESYASHPGAAGIDAAYVATQARYLLGSAATAATAANDLVQRAQELASAGSP